MNNRSENIKRFKDIDSILDNLVVSIFENVISKNPKNINFIKIIHAIKNGRWKDRIGELRNLIQSGKKEKYDDKKRYLPAVTISGNFKNRNEIIKHSGLLQVDLDNLHDPEEIRDLIGRDPHLVSSFISPSGKGVKGIIRIPSETEKHIESFNAVETFLRDKYNLQMDKSRKDVNGLCFISHDPDLVFNDSAVEINLETKNKIFNEKCLNAIDLKIKWGSTDWYKVFESASLIKGAQGKRVNVLCPWRNQHTKDKDNGSYLFKGSEGTWGWTCHHDHCQERNHKHLALELQDHVLKHSQPFKPDVIQRVQTKDGIFVTELDQVEWERPLELPREPEPPQDLPEELLTDPFKKWVLDLSERMSSPPEMIYVPIMIAFGSALGTQISVKLKRDDFSWIMPPILWGCVIAPPGRKKSPATSPAISIIKELEYELREKSLPSIKEQKTNLEFEKTRRKSILSRIEQELKRGNEVDAENLRYELNQLTIDDEISSGPRLITSDATPSMLIRLCKENPEGLLLSVDELVSIFKNCEKKGNEDLRPILLQGFDGDKHYFLDRKSEGLSDSADQVAISVFGTTQPGVLQHEIRKAVHSPDGLLARFCLAIYPRKWDFRQIDRSPDLASYQLVRKLFHQTRPLNWSEVGAQKSDQDRFPFIGFDDEAQEYFNEWQLEFYNERLASPNMPEYLKNHISKHEKLVCVLSLIFHVSEVLSGKRNPGKITMESFSKAAAWSQLLEEHAMRIYSSIFTGSVHRARILANRIIEGKLERGFSSRNIKHKGWSGLTTPELIQDALETLEEKNWIRALKIQSAKAGGRPSNPKWEINPELNKNS